MDHYDFSGNNPFAPPNRRYCLSKQCLERGQQPSFDEDKDTWDVFRYLRKRQTADEPSQRTQLRRDYHDFSTAFAIRFGKARKLRPVVEAYILGDADDGAIAKRLAVPRGTVYWYRRTFYDVEHLRQAPLHVIHQLIGIHDEEGQSVLAPHRLWKLIGFAQKAAALDQLFHVGDSPIALGEGGAAAWISRQMEFAVRLKQWIAVQGLKPDDPKHAETLLKLWGQERHSQRDSEDNSLNPYEQCAKSFLDGLTWTFGVSGEEAFKDTPIGKYDMSAAELRADELLSMATGQEVPGLEERLEKLPPPRKRRPIGGEGGAGELLT
jgi:hypothetical protein